MRGKCERGRGSANDGAAGANVIRRKAEGYAGEVQTRTGRVQKSSRAMSFRGSAFSAHGCDFTAVARRTYI